MKNTACICLAALTLASCATTAEYGGKLVAYGKQASSWVGQKVESLFAKEGPPSSIQPQPDGGSVIQYQHSQQVQIPPPGAAPQTSPAAGALTPAAADTARAEPPVQAAKDAKAANIRIVPCTTRYRTDNTGTIRSWTIDGEGCKAVEEYAPPQRH